MIRDGLNIRVFSDDLRGAIIDRLKELSERDPDSLTNDDFNQSDGSHLLKMAEKFLPMKQVRERHPHTGEVTVKEVADLSALPGLNEISLLTFLKKNKTYT